MAIGVWVRGGECLVVDGELRWVIAFGNEDRDRYPAAAAAAAAAAATTTADRLPPPPMENARALRNFRETFLGVLGGNVSHV